MLKLEFEVVFLSNFRFTEVLTTGEIRDFLIRILGMSPSENAAISSLNQLIEGLCYFTLLFQRHIFSFFAACSSSLLIALEIKGFDEKAKVLRSEIKSRIPEQISQMNAARDFMLAKGPELTNCPIFLQKFAELQAKDPENLSDLLH